jgi:hypothetical protein
MNHKLASVAALTLALALARRFRRTGSIVGTWKLKTHAD